MIEAMEDAVFDRGRPFLGICVGMQLLADAGEEFGRHCPDTLFGKLAVRRASEIHVGIDKTVLAVRAFAGGVVLEKFNTVAALRTFGFKNRSWLPVLGILSRAFHIYCPPGKSYGRLR
jgi:anthranilate/para-aminobenzoate synthase component II